MNYFLSRTGVIIISEKGTIFSKHLQNTQIIGCFAISFLKKDMRQPIVSILLPVLRSHVNGSEFTFPDWSGKEMCGMMGNLVADRRRRKGPNVRTTGISICRDYRQHAEEKPTKQGEP